jgi:hypothetical protein
MRESKKMDAQRQSNNSEKSHSQPSKAVYGSSAVLMVLIFVMTFGCVGLNKQTPSDHRPFDWLEGEERERMIDDANALNEHLAPSRANSENE